MQEPKTLKSKAPAPDTQDWYAYVQKTVQETPNRLEDAAKFLATIISLTITLFLAIGKSSFENHQTFLSLKIAMAIMLFALLAAFFVIFPQHYKYHNASAESIKEMHRKIVRSKGAILLVGVSFYLTALVILSVQFFSL